MGPVIDGWRPTTGEVGGNCGGLYGAFGRYGGMRGGEGDGEGVLWTFSLLDVLFADLTYLSADERSYERDARKLETVEAALFGRARCRRAVRVGEPKGGRRDDDATLVLATAGAASGSETCSSGGLRSALALGERSRASTLERTRAPDQRRDLGAHTTQRVIERRTVTTFHDPIFSYDTRPACNHRPSHFDLVVDTLSCTHCMPRWRYPSPTCALRPLPSGQACFTY